MSADLRVASINPELLAKMKEFRLRKELTNAVIIVKIDMEKFEILEDADLMEELDEVENPTIDDIASVLPAHQPRYIIYSYVMKHDDGRISYPLCFIFVSPTGGKPTMQMTYAGSKLHFVKDGEFTKVFEIRSVEELTEEWLLKKLSFFR